MKLSHSSKKTRSLGEMISTFCFFWHVSLARA